LVLENGEIEEAGANCLRSCRSQPTQVLQGSEQVEEGGNEHAGEDGGLEIDRAVTRVLPSNR